MSKLRVLVCVSLLATFVLLAAPQSAPAQGFPDPPIGTGTPVPPDHAVYSDPGATTSTSSTLTTSLLGSFAQDLYTFASQNWLAAQLRTLRAGDRSVAVHPGHPVARGATRIRAARGTSR